MKTYLPILAASLALAAASPALAFMSGSGSGSSGGDREPAGGAFMSSFTYPGSTGVQAGGPPRSVDIPQNGYGYGYTPPGYHQPYAQPAPRARYQRGW
jgi:hypothetical protein